MRPRLAAGPRLSVVSENNQSGTGELHGEGFNGLREREPPQLADRRPVQERVAIGTRRNTQA
jgi:hypothetical protein